MMGKTKNSVGEIKVKIIVDARAIDVALAKVKKLEAALDRLYKKMVRGR